MENQLTKVEESTMLILWRLRRAFVKDIIAHMNDPHPPYNTVSSVMRILVQKGYVSYKAYGKTHEYFPLVSINTYRKTALQWLIENYYQNSTEYFMENIKEELNFKSL